MNAEELIRIVVQDWRSNRMLSESDIVDLLGQWTAVFLAACDKKPVPVHPSEWSSFKAVFASFALRMMAVAIDSVDAGSQLFMLHSGCRQNLACIKAERLFRVLANDRRLSQIDCKVLPKPGRPLGRSSAFDIETPNCRVPISIAVESNGAVDSWGEEFGYSDNPATVDTIVEFVQRWVEGGKRKEEEEEKAAPAPPRVRAFSRSKARRLRRSKLAIHSVSQSVTK